MREFFIDKVLQKEIKYQGIKFISAIIKRKHIIIACKLQIFVANIIFAVKKEELLYQ